MHCAYAHKVQVTRCRDELINTVAYLARRDIISIYDNDNGQSKTPEKQILYCRITALTSDGLKIWVDSGVHIIRGLNF